MGNRRLLFNVLFGCASLLEHLDANLGLRLRDRIELK